MTIYYYLTKNKKSDRCQGCTKHHHERRNPECVGEHKQVKHNMTDCQSIIMTDRELEEKNAVVKFISLNQAQQKLDQWIADENRNPELDKDGNPLIQPNINLDNWKY